MQFIPVMAKLNLQQPLLHFLICWFGVQETFLIIINVENSCAAALYFCRNHDTFDTWHSSINWWI